MLQIHAFVFSDLFAPSLEFQVKAFPFETKKTIQTRSVTTPKKAFRMPSYMHFICGKIMLHDEFREASSPETSTKRLLELAQHKDEIIRGAVAMNPSSPMECKIILFNDPSNHVIDNLLATNTIN